MSIKSDSEDACPVGDDLLGQLYRASKDGLPALIATVSPDIRAALASYCYRRGHLQAIGLAIASTCEEHDLIHWGGSAGAALFARSHEADPAPRTLSHYNARQTITLASGPLRTNLPMQEHADDEPEAHQEHDPGEIADPKIVDQK